MFPEWLFRCPQNMHYIKVKGRWHYLYRAINKQGETLDFYFSHKRNKEAAYQFLRRYLRYYDLDNQPKTLKTDKHSSYANAIARLKKEGRLRVDVEQRQVKYLNNGIKSDHAPIKKLVVATGGLKYEIEPGQPIRDSGIRTITDAEQRPV